MTTKTRKELIDLGATIQEGTGLLAGSLPTAAYVNGAVYLHEPSDYQEGAGNHYDYQLFRLVNQSQREPFYGGVRYLDDDGNIVLEIEYPAPMTETGADILILSGLDKAAKEGVFVYLLGSDVSLK